MWLVHHGVPFEIAFGLKPGEFQMTPTLRTALAIICSEFEGQKFNFHTWEFEKPQ